MRSRPTSWMAGDAKASRGSVLWPNEVRFFMAIGLGGGVGGDVTACRARMAPFGTRGGANSSCIVEITTALIRDASCARRSCREAGNAVAETGWCRTVRIRVPVACVSEENEMSRAASVTRAST